MAVNRIRGAFAVPRKGETFELRAGLVSQYAYERKESIQKTIMAMTLGKDVSALFPDVLKNIATADLDQKKLCTEWGRVTILTTLADYPAADAKESEHICERVAPQFQHVNPSVVLAAVKVVFIHMKAVSPELVRSYLKKMAPPLVTLVASAPEVQYVALRNIDLLLQAKPDILSKELRVFFCKYNDPPYVKLQKLEIMVRIANEKNFDQLLAELKEYALEVDMDFVKRAVKAIGQVAIKLESASQKCVNALLDLIATKVNYVVQEVVVVIKDILRKYPGYEGVIPTLCKYIDELDEPTARGSLIWIVGEYAEKINNADDILAGFVEGFMEEFTQTQLQILTAVVKLFLKKPGNTQSLVQKVLQQATTDNDNPDIRDRAYVYWRLLSGDLDVAKSIVLSQKPAITTTMTSLPPALLEQLLAELSTLASVYHKPPESFVGKGRYGADEIQRAAIREQRQEAAENPIAASNLLDIDFDGAAPASAEQQSNVNTPDRVSSPSGGAPSSAMADMMGLFDAPPPQQQQQAMANPMSPGAGGSGMDDMMNGFSGLDFGNTGSGQPLPAGMQLHPTPQTQQPSEGNGKKTNEDLLGLF
ncbi:AP-1 complex subunit beta [Colletotrichum liriopes]|uniref:AP complex subunit beta n=1 Tax=Colletotrichum liriopes TaxID=708192 RepID=A0AA37LLZ9_9PEZI|nr:AP-1 complex subunit beta [Colletotrichum liriopes]